MYARLLLALVLAGWLIPVAALGLGPATVHSGLGEPLDASVPLSGAPADATALRVGIASREAFARIGLERATALAGVTVTLQSDATGAAVLRLKSAAAMHEPLLAMVLELRYGDVPVFHEVTLLLDPVAAFPVRRAIATAPGSASRAARAVPTSRLQDGGSAVGTVWVSPGDTLYGIAARLVAEEGGEVANTALALYRANPDAFIRGNADLIIAGIRLTLPEQVTTLAPAEARRQLAAGASYPPEGIAATKPPAIGAPEPATASQSTALPAEPQAALPEGGFRLSLMTAEEEAEAFPSSSGAVAPLRSREEIQRLHDEVRAQIAAMESQRAERQLAARTKPAVVALPAAVPASISATAVVHPAQDGPAPDAGVGVVTGTAAMAAQDLPRRLLELVAGWDPAALVADESSPVIVLLAVVLVLVALAGAWSRLRRVRRASALRARHRNTTSGESSRTAVVDDFADDERAAVTPPAAGFATADWLDGTMATSELREATGKELERGISETLSASEACLRHGYDDVAEALLRDLVEVCPHSVDLRMRLLRVLHARRRPVAFVQQARRLRELVAADAPQWLTICRMGSDLLPTEMLFEAGNHALSEQADVTRSPAREFRPSVSSHGAWRSQTLRDAGS